MGVADTGQLCGARRCPGWVYVGRFSPEQAVMHGNGPAGPPGDGIACLDALAAQMHARGWSAYITTPAGRLASLFVQGPRDRAECGDVIAACDATTGQWWYWFSWAERITPAHVPAAAADAIISAFRRPPDDSPEPGPESSKHPVRGHPQASRRHAPHRLPAARSRRSGKREAVRPGRKRGRALRTAAPVG
jgi:hypothetical protein